MCFHMASSEKCLERGLKAFRDFFSCLCPFSTVKVVALDTAVLDSAPSVRSHPTISDILLVR